MTSLDTAKIREEVDEVLAIDRANIEDDFGDPCASEGRHSNRCQLMMEHQSKPCILEQISVARRRQKRLAVLELLTKCAQSPSEVNGLRVLEGIATDSCI